MTHPLPARVIGPEPATEDFLAELTDAAYRVALEHGIAGSFLDVQLDLWAALRRVVADKINP